MTRSPVMKHPVAEKIGYLSEEKNEYLRSGKRTLILFLQKQDFLSYDRMFFTSKELILLRKLSLKNDYMSPKLPT